MTIRDKAGRFSDTSDRRVQSRRAVEAGIQRAFAQAIRLFGGPRVLAWACPNEGNRGKVQTSQLVAQGLMAGAADYTVMWAGGGALIEFKAPGGYQTPAQREFEASAKGAGVPYAVCRSWQEAWRYLEACGAPLAARLDASDARLVGLNKNDGGVK